MNWKLLLVALSLSVVSISARPADETQPAAAVAEAAPLAATTTKNVVGEVTNLTEKPTTLPHPQPTKSTEDVTKKATPTEAATPSTTASHAPTTTRYLQPPQSLPSTKLTNSAHKTKYANNYSNLITKHTLMNSKRFVNNTAPNKNVANHEFVISSSSNKASSGSSLNNNSLEPKSTAAAAAAVVTTTAVVESNEVPSLPPFATISSAASSNSSSKPLMFVDADDFPAVAAFVDPTTSTTKRAFIALNNNAAGGGGWPSFNQFDHTKATPVSMRKKPVIHKIISKWSDNPSEVFNFHGDSPLISSQQAHINELKNQLVQSAFNQHNSVLSFDNLPTIIGQQLIHQQQHMPTYEPPPPPSPSAAALPSSPTKSSVSDLILLKKKPINNNIDEELLDRCREVRIKLGTSVNGKIDSAEEGECKGLSIHIDNKIDNSNYHSTNDYELPSNDKYEDPPTEELYDSNFIEVDSDAVSHLHGHPSIHKHEHDIEDDGEKKKNKKKKHKSKKNKKKQGDFTESQFEEESETEEETTTTEMSSMMMTVVTMMAIFNPLNFGVWGLLLAPVAAITLGGIVFAMYHFTQHKEHHHSQPIWQIAPAAPHPWPKPQEIIVKNKINHSPIPIKITHLHKHTAAPQKIVYSHHQPPPQHHHHQQPQQQPVVEYAPPWHSAPSAVKNSYGEPPADSYYPSAPSGNGPYRRKTLMPKQKQPTQKQQQRRHKNRGPNPFRYKLL